MSEPINVFFLPGFWRTSVVLGKQGVLTAEPTWVHSKMVGSALANMRKHPQFKLTHTYCQKCKAVTNMYAYSCKYFLIL